MASGNEFEDKAARLLNRLSSVSNPAPAKTRIEGPKVSIQEISRLKDDLECSETETRKRMKSLGDIMKKLEGSLVQEAQARAQKDEAFSQTISKLEKNMKIALSNVQRGFSEREKKLSDKIDLLIKTERKELDGKLRQNEELIDQMDGLQSKIAAIVDQVTSLRRARVELQERINRQFGEQLRQLKRIFEVDVRAREEREVKVIQTLKGVYKNSMQRILIEQKQRQQSQKVLMAVIEQLVDHIIEA